jgi:hypothetical protein
LNLGQWLVGDKGRFYCSFQNVGSWGGNKPAAQVPVCVQHPAKLIIKESNNIVEIKAIQVDAGAWGRARYFQLRKYRPD